MGTHHGKNGVVKVGANTVAEVQSFSITKNVDLAEDTAMGDAWKSFLPGVKGATGSIECSWDETDTNGQEALVEGAEVTLNLYPEGAGSGAKYLTLAAIITEVVSNVQRGAVVTRNFNFTANGAVSDATV